jgi:hypothetical protein
MRAWWGIACVVMAGLVAGCVRPAGPSGLVRAGQTGRYVSFQAGPVSAYQVPAVELPPRLLLDDLSTPSKEVVVTGYLSPLITLRTQIVVTENAADEEFWEFIVRALPGLPSDAWHAVDRPFLVLGPQNQCEAMRDLHARNNVQAGPCIGPHYFKRTGPPVPLNRTG